MLFRAPWYTPCTAPWTVVPPMWPITFALVMDDFAVKYTDTRDALHLMNALKPTTKWAKIWKQCGIADSLYSGIISTALSAYPCLATSNAHYYNSAMPRTLTTCMVEMQVWSQGAFCWHQMHPGDHGGSIILCPSSWHTLLTDLGSLGIQQIHGTKRQIMETITQLQNYCAMHPDASIHHTSNMIFLRDSNALNLTAPKGHLHAGYHS